MRRHAEALWWSLFSVGGVMAALFIPALIFATSFMLPTNNPDVAVQRYELIASRLSLWPVRIVLLGVMTLAAFHCAHRVRHILMDIGLRHYDNALVYVSYASAAIVSLVAAYLLVFRL
jgi:fumarate reductase subunit D